MFLFMGRPRGVRPAIIFACLSIVACHYRALAKYSTAGWHPNLFAKPATQPRGSAESSRSLSASAVCDPDINTEHSKKLKLSGKGWSSEPSFGGRLEDADGVLCI